MVAIELDLGPIMREIDMFDRALGINLVSVAHDSMRMRLNNMVKWTPPLGNKVSSRRVGEHAIDVALTKIVFDTKDADADFSRTETLDADAILRAHEIARDERGRVPRNYHKRIKRSPAKRAQINKALKKIKEGVGSLKAGWLPALRYYAGRSKGKMVAPSWVTRHSSPGSYTDTLKRNGSGDMTATNGVPWADNNDSMKRAVEFTGKIQQRDLLKRARTRIDKLAQQFNAKGS